MTRKPTIAQVIAALKSTVRGWIENYSDVDGEITCPRAKHEIACLKRAIEIVKAKGGK